MRIELNKIQYLLNISKIHKKFQQHSINIKNYTVKPVFKGHCDEGIPVIMGHFLIRRRREIKMGILGYSGGAWVANK